MQSELEVVDEWISDSKKILDQQENTDFDFSNVEELYKDSKKFRIQSEEINQVQQALYPIISWVEEASKFIEKQSIRPKSKGKKKIDPLGNNKIPDIILPSKDDKKQQFTPYEILVKLPIFFESKKEETPVIVEECFEREFKYPNEMEVDQPQVEENKDVIECFEAFEKAPVITNPTFTVQKMSKGRDMTSVVDSLFEDDKNLAVSKALHIAAYHKKISKVFKIEQSKSEGDKEHTNQEFEIQEPKPISPYKEIDELLDEKGRIRYSTPVVKTFDKELNDQLESLMKDYRGRARKTKPEDEERIETQNEIKNEKNLSCNQHPTSLLSPDNKYWLKFDKIERIHSKILEFLKVSEEWREK